MDNPQLFNLIRSRDGATSLKPPLTTAVGLSTDPPTSFFGCQRLSTGWMTIFNSVVGLSTGPLTTVDKAEDVVNGCQRARGQTFWAKKLVDGPPTTADKLFRLSVATDNRRQAFWLVGGCRRAADNPERHLGLVHEIYVAEKLEKQSPNR